MSNERPTSSASEITPRSPASTPTGPVRVFVIFDVEHDQDLYERLHTQSLGPGYDFEVIAGSRRTQDTETWREAVRRQIRHAGQVIVICGEHAESSPRIHTELQIAKDEAKPYFMLWGRRGVMCTKPVGVTNAEGMYSWTRQFLHDQIEFNLRKAGTDARARSLRKVTPKPRALEDSTDSEEDAAPRKSSLSGR